MFSVPCGCRGELNSYDEPMGFSDECPTAQEIFSRLISDPEASRQDNPVAAELKEHVTAQL